MSAVQRVDRRRLRTRAALLNAGKALFAEHGVDAVTIDDIVAAADVAKGSFYNHFPDKGALAQALADLARAAVESQADQVNAGVADPAERAARALCAFARGARDHPDNARLGQRLFQGGKVPDAPMNAGVRADIKDGLDAGRFHGLPLEAAVLLAVGAVQITMSRILDGERGLEPTALAQEMAFGLLRGLGLDPAEARGIAARAAAAIFQD